MKQFFKDMAELQKESNKFLKKHWKGYILFSVIIGTVTYFGTWFAMSKLCSSKESINDFSTEEES